jgi:phospholipid/cholesterol/gamma-HCH transport system substrate-binding protein
MSKEMIKTEAKVGLFVLLGIVLLFYMTFKISGHRKVKGEGKKYFAKFDDVSGIVEKGKVVIAGVDAGWVEQIRLTKDGKAQLAIVIDKNVTLKTDAKAYIKTYGFMGEKYVEVFPGESVDILPSGSYISNTYTEKSIADVANRISDAADEFRKVMKTLNVSLLGKKGEGRLAEILNNFEKFSKNLDEILAKNKGKFQNIIDNVDSFSKKLSESSDKFNTTFANLSEIAENLAKGKGTMGKLLKDDSLYKNLDKTFASLDKVADKINSGKGTLGKLINDDEFYNDLKHTFKGLGDISEKIAEGKGTLGKLVNDDSIYNDLKITMSNLRDITVELKSGKGSIGKMLTDDEMYKSIDKTLLRIQEAASGFSEQTPISTFGVVMGTLFSF